MRKLVLYIATSLDGYIARQSGDVDWLFHDQDYGFKKFFITIDTVLMGRRTYEQVLTFGGYPYSSTQGFVFSRTREGQQDKNVKFISGNIVKFVQDLKASEGKNIWLIGGFKIIEPLIKNDLIDEYIISIHPIILGEGIPLFPANFESIELKLKICEYFESGLVQLTFER